MFKVNQVVKFRAKILQPKLNKYEGLEVIIKSVEPHSTQEGNTLHAISLDGKILKNGGRTRRFSSSFFVEMKSPWSEESLIKSNFTLDELILKCNTEFTESEEIDFFDNEPKPSEAL